MSLLSKEEQAAAESAEVFGGSFEALPAGRYVCRLVQLEPHTTGTSFAVRWKIAVGQKYAGRTFIDFPSRKPEYLGKIKSIILALGGKLSDDADALLGRVAYVTVSEEFDNRPDHAGEKQNKVKFVTAYDGPALEEEGGDGDIDAAFGPEDGLI